MMVRILAAVLIGLALLVGGTSIAYADGPKVGVSRAQVGDKCYEKIADKGYKGRKGDRRDARYLPTSRLLTLCGIGTVRAEDGSLVPWTYYTR